jgi:hypothetical protein
MHIIFIVPKTKQRAKIIFKIYWHKKTINHYRVRGKAGQDLLFFLAYVPVAFLVSALSWAFVYSHYILRLLTFLKAAAKVKSTTAKGYSKNQK